MFKSEAEAVQAAAHKWRIDPAVFWARGRAYVAVADRRRMSSLVPPKLAAALLKGKLRYIANRFVRPKIPRRKSAAVGKGKKQHGAQAGRG